MSIENPTLAHFRHLSSLFTNLPSTSVENPLQISSFLCKTNPISRMSEVRYLSSAFCLLSSVHGHESKPTFAANNLNDARLSGRSSWRAHSLHDKSKVRGYNPSRCVTTKEKTKGSCKIEVRHILFKKICFFDFPK
jgi:hypothetical protein